MGRRSHSVHVRFGGRDMRTDRREGARHGGCDRVMVVESDREIGIGNQESSS